MVVASGGKRDSDKQIVKRAEKESEGPENLRFRLNLHSAKTGEFRRNVFDVSD